MKKLYIYLFAALLAIYVLLAFTLPPDPQVMDKHGLTVSSARLVSLSVVVPITLIYLTALYGFIRVKDYTDKISDTKEGPHFRDIAKGLMFLAFSLPVGSALGSLGSYARHSQPHLLSDITILRQYVALLFAFTAVYFLSRGARGLYDTLKRPADGRRSPLVLLGPIFLASVYTLLITTQGRSQTGDQPYYLPEWLVILTIAIPYVYIWCTGIAAAILMHRYQRSVKGVIYKRAIYFLALGIAGIIFVSVVLQFLATLAGFLNRLDLTPLLGVVYVLIALYAVGYGLVARGAKKLKQIEEA